MEAELKEETAGRETPKNGPTRQFAQTKLRLLAWPSDCSPKKVHTCAGALNTYT